MMEYKKILELNFEEELKKMNFEKPIKYWREWVDRNREHITYLKDMTFTSNNISEDNCERGSVLDEKQKEIVISIDEFEKLLERSCYNE